jgi:Holliday junction resolvase RusA-like endonuclease
VNKPERFTIDGLPPSSNHGYRQGKRHVYKDIEVAAWQGMVKRLVLAQRSKPPQRWKGKPVHMVCIFVGIPRRRDVTNAVKYLEDAVARALGFNDGWVDWAEQRRVKGRPVRTVVTLEEMA